MSTPESKSPKHLEEGLTVLEVSGGRGPGMRLDKYLSDTLPELSRSRIQDLIKDGHILLNDGPAKPKHALAEGDQITVHIPEPEPMEALPQDIPLEVLFEDASIIVINKPSGLVVHPAAGNPDGTLVNALLHHCRGQLSGIGGVLRPGIVHRLDKDTSGCLVAAKSDAAHQELTRQFSGREVKKTYLCVVQEVPEPPAGEIRNRIGRHPVNRQKMAEVNAPAGKEAATDYRVVKPFGDHALVECDLHTGRTHQIRVHMKGLGHPILGDPIYAQPSRQSVKTSRLMLHAWKLSFTHPETKERLTFESSPPEPFHRFLRE